jgi:hypothetical protein
MKTRIFTLILCAVFSMGGAISQEYYYWYKGEKVPLELDPTKKYILLDNAADTIALKNRTDARVKYGSFISEPYYGINFIEGDPQKVYTWTIVEGQELPEFSADGIYEAPVFKQNISGSAPEVALTHAFYVKLKNSDDFGLLETLAHENNVVILGNNPYMPEWFTLSCTRISSGNALEMADFFYESNLFADAEPEFYSLGIDITGKGPTKIKNASVNDVAISSFDSQINVVSTNSIDYVEVYALDGRILYASSYLNVPNVNLNLPAHKGVVIVQVKLQSGSVLHKKLLLK